MNDQAQGRVYRMGTSDAPRLIKASMNAEDVALANKYAKHPDEFDQIPPGQLAIFRLLINKCFSDLSDKIYFEFVDYEPYGTNPSIKDMLNDFYRGHIKIHTTGNDSKVWGKFHNLQFRAIHDYVHCLYANDFTHREERKVLGKQLEFHRLYGKDFPFLNWDLFGRILRSEIVYQSAFKEYYGEFHIEQKIILADLY